MKDAGLYQAREKLQSARDALSRMTSAETYRAAGQAWSDFLLASNGVYSKLEQGAKGCPASEGWFGRKKHDRKTDELLKYLHHARNADEHGIEGTTLAMVAAQSIKGKLHSIGIRLGFDREPEILVRKETGAEVKIERYLGVKNVKDARYGDTFSPPKRHLKNDLPNEQSGIVRADQIATLALAYIECLIAEAAKLPVHK
jgi:hypothetical protein